jgi:hypothetical protein
MLAMLVDPEAMFVLLAGSGDNWIEPEARCSLDGTAVS